MNQYSNCTFLVDGIAVDGDVKVHDAVGDGDKNRNNNGDGDEDEDDYNSDDDTTSEEARAEALAREQGLRSVDGRDEVDEEGFTYCCRDDDGM